MCNHFVGDATGVAPHARRIHPDRAMKASELLGGGWSRYAFVATGVGRALTAPRGWRGRRRSGSWRLRIQLLAGHVRLDALLALLAAS